MSDSAPSSPIPSPPRAQSSEKRRLNVPAALFDAPLSQWSVSSAAEIAVKARPGMELAPWTLDAVSAACSEIILACASFALVAGPVGRMAGLAGVEAAVCALLWRPRATGVPPHGPMARRGHKQAREMATLCSGAAALQPEVTGLLVDLARRRLMAGGNVKCEGCDEQAIAYLGAVADFVCSEMLTAAVGQAEQECCRRVLPCHLNAALMADRELVETWPRCFGSLEVERQPVPFCRARFGAYDRPIRDCPMVVFEDDERLDEEVFGAVAVVRLSENPTRSFASRAQDAQRAGAIALILICSDNILFEPTCRASESEGLTIPVVIVAQCDRSLFSDEGTISLSLNVHGLAMCGERPKSAAERPRSAVERNEATLHVAGAETASKLPSTITPGAPSQRLAGDRRQMKRAAFPPVWMNKSGPGPSEQTVDLSELVARIGPNGKRAKKSAFEAFGDRFSLPSLVPKPTATPTLLHRT